jgi:NAD(P)-dependent dehydrogenase (short-subunit alcohol dehydrogenase family)
MFFMNRESRFKNKVVLVTGGSSGIGQTTAQAFAREGAAVVVVGRREEPLLQTVKLIQDAGGVASYITANISNAAEVERMIKTCEERHGGLHVAFNNVGIIGKPKPTAEIEEDEWAEILATNLTGIWLCMKSDTCKHMAAVRSSTRLQILERISVVRASVDMLLPRPPSAHSLATQPGNTLLTESESMWSAPEPPTRPCRVALASLMRTETRESRRSFHSAG